MTNSDTLTYSTVILYRPDNQLSRKYKISTNINGTFEINNKEVIKLDSKTNTFEISVDATGHKKETFTFNLPDDVAPGALKVTATLNYQLLVKPVADFLGVPEEESRVMTVNDHSTTITVLP